MVKQRHAVFARDAERSPHLGHQQSRGTLQQRREPALGSVDRVAMKQDFLALGTVKGAHNDALAQQTVDRAF